MVDLLPILLIFLCVGAFAVALLVTPVVRGIALRCGYVDNPGARKIHQTVTPYGGGVAILVSLFTIGIATTCALLQLRETDSFPAIRRVLGPTLEKALETGTMEQLLVVLIGASCMFLLGFLDDILNFPALPKLAVQVLIATGVVLGGVRASFFVPNVLLTSAVTVCWLLLVTNAFNLLDNMDGLSAGVAAIASLLLLAVAMQGEALLISGFIGVFAGALLGFLWHNFPPARLFMGDAGSLFVGFILASLTVTGTYYEGRESLYAVTMPLLILGVPLFDTCSVMWLRWRRGKPLFVGDTNHISHRLVRLGMTRREAVLTIYLLGLILGGAATLLRQLSPGGAIIILLIGFGIIALLVLLENAAARHREGVDHDVTD